MPNPLGVFDDSGADTVTTVDDTLTVISSFDLPNPGDTCYVEGVLLGKLISGTGAPNTALAGRYGFMAANVEGVLKVFQVTYGDQPAIFTPDSANWNNNVGTEDTSVIIPIQGIEGAIIAWKSVWTRSNV